MLRYFSTSLVYAYSFATGMDAWMGHIWWQLEMWKMRFKVPSVECCTYKCKYLVFQCRTQELISLPLLERLDIVNSNDTKTAIKLIGNHKNATHFGYRLHILFLIFFC